MTNKVSIAKILAALAFSFGLLFGSTSTAATLAELHAADKLRITSWIEPDQDIIVGQQVKLQIEIATDSFFSRGTRFGHFEVEDAIVLQRENFALNSTRTEGGKNWTVQQWTLVIYPQRSGEFEVPAIPLMLSVMGEDSRAVTGSSTSPPLTFNAQQPAALQGQQGWIATNRFSIKEQFDKPLEELRPGDALVRTIRMSADNLPAMMLPPVMADSVDGISIYNKPPRLNDKVNRGDYLAERSQQITYVLEQPGNFTLAQQEFYWWNLDTDEVETIILPAHELVVSGVAGQTGNDGQDAVDPREWIMTRLPAVVVTTAIVILSLVLLWLLRRWLAARLSTSTGMTETPSRHQLLRQARQACRTGNDARALDYLYQWLGHDGRHRNEVIATQVESLDDPELKLTYERVMREIFAGESASSSDTWRFIEAFTRAKEKQQKSRAFLSWRVDLKLN